ncbi:MAG: hypothetical protein NVS4B11_16760 [Ktedonobacteraceae bacterium]
MGNFLRGFLFGLGLGVLVAPMRGQEMRRLLINRFQELRGSIPEKTQLNQYAQQISARTTQTASTLKDYAQQATAQVKDTASSLGNIAQQAGASTKDTASNLGSIAQQAGSDAKSAASDVAQQVNAKVKDTVSNLSDTAQQATAQVKDATSSVVNVAQQAGSNVKDTASNLVDTTQQAGSNVKDTSKDTINTTAQAITQAKQNVQPQTTSSAALSNGTSSATSTPALGDSLSTIPGIEPEIQSKLEAHGIHTTQQLLEQTRTKEERSDLSQKVSVSSHMLRTLADRADFMRLQGVGADVAVMLEEAGVNGCKDLRRRNPEHLYATLTEAHSTGNIATSVPDIDQVTRWIAEAMAVTGSQE